jgi:hypothetical protein
VVRSDAPHGDSWWRQAGPPRALGGSHTHRPVFKHGSGVENHPVMPRLRAVPLTEMAVSVKVPPIDMAGENHQPA